MLVFFTNLGLLEFWVRCLALFRLFLLMESFEWFWVGSLHKNIKLMLEFPKTLFLVLQLLTIHNGLMMLSVILLSMLMILLSTIDVIMPFDLW